MPTLSRASAMWVIWHTEKNDKFTQFFKLFLGQLIRDLHFTEGSPFTGTQYPSAHCFHVFGILHKDLNESLIRFFKIAFLQEFICFLPHVSKEQ